VHIVPADDLTHVESHFGPKETLERLVAEVQAKGLTVFAQIEHAEGAAAVGMTLRPTTVVVFGSPRGGTPLMQASQLIGLDLPLKVLVWQDATGQARLTYIDPRVLMKRYGLPSELEPVANNLAGALRALTAKAAGAQALSASGSGQA
jgi:uncharacterized protein (DUF302 family)